MKRLIYAFIVVLMFLSGCSNATQSKGEATTEGSKKLQIVTTFYPMYYFTQKVAGNLADVDLLIQNGAEPHDWEPSSKDMAKIQEADMFIYNSSYFETWTEKVLKSIDQSNLEIVEASKGIELIDADSEEEGNDQSSKDPHVWLSPVLAGQEVD